jgi:glycogen operon protein
MLLGGDELARTQRGNNNTYCQDNELAWYDWDHADLALQAFTTQVIRLRREHPVFRRHNWFAGNPIGQPHADDLPDVAWFSPDGTEMVQEQWSEEMARSVMVFLNGLAIAERDRRGEPIIDDCFVLVFNAQPDDLTMTLPGSSWGRAWVVELDTARDAAAAEAVVHASDAELKVTGRSMQVLRRLDDPPEG